MRRSPSPIKAWLAARGVSTLDSSWDLGPRPSQAPVSLAVISDQTGCPNQSPGPATMRLAGSCSPGQVGEPSAGSVCRSTGVFPAGRPPLLRYHLKTALPENPGEAALGTKGLARKQCLRKNTALAAGDPSSAQLTVRSLPHLSLRVSFINLKIHSQGND